MTDRAQAEFDLWIERQFKNLEIAKQENIISLRYRKCRRETRGELQSLIAVEYFPNVNPNEAQAFCPICGKQPKGIKESWILKPSKERKVRRRKHE